MKNNAPILLGFVVSSAWGAGASLSARQANWTVGQAVRINGTSIIGHAAPQATEVSEYLGIPFAQPPLADLRFAAPVPYASKNTTIDASEFVCIDRRLLSFTDDSLGTRLPSKLTCRSRSWQ